MSELLLGLFAIVWIVASVAMLVALVDPVLLGAPPAENYSAFRARRMRERR